ncbi:nose resistant to fluoxetine protein 6-like isoform X2 [Harmonia axyridis]|uniref:nose resistant to fluoxetine protein 6-like isoform X2 n=1 Tax=Harmonia axyridis TaxID=115357 RepID=UPI001E276685|nr:nose resistant to fluoxetine protein 6-like isoform X2 [Harmonia axyridis]
MKQNGFQSFSLYPDEDYSSLPPVFKADNFDNCMLLREKALYCTISYQLQAVDEENPSKKWNNIKELIKNPRNYRHDILRHGICVPTTCPNATTYLKEISQFEAEMTKCYNNKFAKDGLNGGITYMHCQTNRNLPLDEYDISMITFLTIYLTLVLIATIFEGLARYKPKIEYEEITGTSFGKIMTCFSIPYNFYRLKTIKENEEIKSLKVIQGIRFLNMILVILCHNIMLTLLGPISNTKFVETLTDNFENIFFASGGYVVQTFFLISSWLLTYNVLKMFENEKKIELKVLFWMFINRYIRLTPTLAVVIGLHASFMRHASRGPFWDHIVGEDHRHCRNNGWTNLLYVNNYVNSEDMCMQQTWYLAADTQLFILGLLILALIKKWKDNIKMILATSLIIGVAIPGILSFLNTSDILVRAYPEVIYNSYLQDRNWHLLFSSGFSNIGAYVIGIIFGYLYYTYRDISFPITKSHMALWYSLTFGLGLSILAISYPMYGYSYVYSRVTSALYWSFGKNIFTLAVAIFIFGITQKIGWLCRSICCWNPFVVLGRLTYSAYLIHVFVLRIRGSSIRNPIYIDRYLFFAGTIGDATMTYIWAFILCLLFEMPISALQKLWIPQKPKKENELLKKSTFPKIVFNKEDV